MTALVELAFAALVARLAAALPDVAVERNRRAEPDFETEGALPLVVLRDGGQEPVESDPGFTRYAVSALVEGHLAASSDAEIGPALNVLYARLGAALFGQAVPLAGGAGDIWPEEGRLERDFVAAAEADRPIASLYLRLSFLLDAPTGAPDAS